MRVTKGKLDGILVVEPDVFEDPRGFFLESYSKKKYFEAGITAEFVQDNHSKSIKNTIRGLHYQFKNGQDKLVRCVYGEVFDVVVDIRKNSPTFGQWESFRLSAANKKQVYVPVGFAHGFCVLSDFAEFEYKCSNYYFAEDDVGIAWNDPELAVEWPVALDEAIISKRDNNNPRLKDTSFIFDK
jgi:dTDP-4-dehydrorhamnose 3,5-epimerase